MNYVRKSKAIVYKRNFFFIERNFFFIEEIPLINVEGMAD